MGGIAASGINGKCELHWVFAHWLEEGGVSPTHVVGVNVADTASNYMLKLAAEKGIKPIIDEILPMSQAAKAIEAVKVNKVRYRFVLKNDL